MQDLPSVPHTGEQYKPGRDQNKILEVFLPPVLPEPASLSRNPSFMLSSLVVRSLPGAPELNPAYQLCIFFLYIYLFYYFILLTALGLRCCARAFSSCGERGLLFVVVLGLLIAVASLVAEHGLQVHGFSSCGSWAQQLWLAGSRVQAQQLWRTGLVAPRHVGSSRTRVQTLVPCIGRRILNHCATREAHSCVLLNKLFNHFKCLYSYLQNKDSNLDYIYFLKNC